MSQENKVKLNCPSLADRAVFSLVMLARESPLYGTDPRFAAATEAALRVLDPAQLLLDMVNAPEATRPAEPEKTSTWVVEVAAGKSTSTKVPGTVPEGLVPALVCQRCYRVYAPPLILASGFQAVSAAVRISAGNRDQAYRPLLFCSEGCDKSYTTSHGDLPSEFYACKAVTYVYVAPEMLTARRAVCG